MYGMSDDLRDMRFGIQLARGRLKLLYEKITKEMSDRSDSKNILDMISTIDQRLLDSLDSVSEEDQIGPDGLPRSPYWK